MEDTVLVYLITGFLDSGKTTLLKETLTDPDFNEDGAVSLIIQLEEGEVEITPDFLEENNAYLEVIDDISELTYERLCELNDQYQPMQVFIEYNGTQSLNDFLDTKSPKGWTLVQIITTVDASTFGNYIINMRSMMFEQARYSDLIIFNRCDDTTKKSMLRGNMKAINRAAQIIYEDVNGNVNTLMDDDLPFDLNAPLIDISDDDYGLWYMDCAEHPEKYNGKKVRLRAMYVEPIRHLQHSLIIGRRAMVCCEDDTSMIALSVTGLNPKELSIGEWIEVEGELKMVNTTSGNPTVVLYASSCKRIPPLADEFVYFS